MMYRIVKTEIWKLKRYHIIWAGILLMLLSVGITLFSSIALDDTVWTFPHLVERVIQNNTTTIFPMCITLIAGYIIAREKSDDTLKSIMTIPISYPALIGGKLIVCGFLSVFLGIASTVFTVAAELLVGGYFKLHNHSDYKFVEIKDLLSYDLALADIPLAKFLEEKYNDKNN